LLLTSLAGFFLRDLLYFYGDGAAIAGVAIVGI